MKRSLNDHPVIVSIMVAAAICTIVTFIILIYHETTSESTGETTSGLTGGQAGGTSSGQTGGTSGGQAGGTSGGQTGGTSGGQTGETTGGQTGGTSGGQTGETTGGQTGGTTNGTTNDPQTSFNLDASIVHYPNTSTGDLVIGGTWKLQGIHEAATSFSQAVRVYYNDDPQIEWFGNAKYGTCWSEEDNNPNNWSEPPLELDELAQYDYPKGTFGTFSVDMSGTSDIPSGAYTCKLSIVINQEIYEISLPFTLE